MDKEIIKDLMFFENKRGKLKIYIIYASPAFLITMAFLNIYAAVKTGEIEGYNFIQLIKYWSSRIDYNKQYSGILVAALERLDTAAFQLGLSLLLIIQIYYARKRCIIDRKILKYLKNNQTTNSQ